MVKRCSKAAWLMFREWKIVYLIWLRSQLFDIKPTSRNQLDPIGVILRLHQPCFFLLLQHTPTISVHLRIKFARGPMSYMKDLKVRASCAATDLDSFCSVTLGFFPSQLDVPVHTGFSLLNNFWWKLLVRHNLAGHRERATQDSSLF